MSSLTRREALFAAGALAGSAVVRAGLARAQSAAPSVGPARLEGIDAATFAALRPLADRGVGVLVREPDGGIRSRISVLVRAQAPLAAVHELVASPERYATFMNGVTSMEVLSRAARRVGFRFHVSAAVFEVTTLASIHLVNPRRIDGEILQSDMGPGGLRWDLFADGEGASYVGYTTWGDPSQANWLLRTLAQVSPGAIAAMQLGYNVFLALSAARRAEIAAGRAVPARPAVRAVPDALLVPPEPGPWSELARDGSVVGALTLDASGSLVQGTVARKSPLAPAALRAALARPDGYRGLWPTVREASVVPAPAGSAIPPVDSQRVRAVIDTPLFRTAGEFDRVLERGPHGDVVRWRGVSGDYANDEQRYDLWPDGEGTLTLHTGPGAGDERRAGMIARTVLDRDPWMLPGYAASWKLVWLGQLLANVRPGAGP